MPVPVRSDYEDLPHFKAALRASILRSREMEKTLTEMLNDAPDTGDREGWVNLHSDCSFQHIQISGQRPSDENVAVMISALAKNVLEMGRKPYRMWCGDMELSDGHQSWDLMVATYEDSENKVAA